MNNKSDAKWHQKFAERGILQVMLDAGAKAYPWNKTQGIAYPLVDENGDPYMLPDGRPAQRWKNLDSSADFKNGWGYVDSATGESKPQGCDIYFPPQVNIREAIAENNGIVHIVCGEPDTWTMLAAGHPNTISFFGEMIIPKNLVETLRAIGASEAHYYPDLDETGRNATNKLEQILRGSGITLYIHELPQETNNDE